MKRLFYFILLLAGFSTIHSCKDLLDEDGNPLVDLNNNNGLNGPRALYREITDADTIAEYHYNGLLLSKVFTRGASVTDVQYSGDKVSTITFNGFQDSDNDGALDVDSTSYVQIFTYGNNGRLESISENRSVYNRDPGVPPTTPPGPWTILKKTKTLYNLAYSTTTDKLETITGRVGEDITGVPFEYTEYSEAAYEYLGDNVSKVVRDYGPIEGGVFGTSTEKYSYEFLNYDTQISPYTLLPTSYKISVLLSTRVNDYRSLILSPNNPKRYTITDLMQPNPTPIVFSTDYNYDPQTYMTKGFGVNYIYKPL